MNGSDAKAVAALSKSYESVLESVGEDPTREGLLETPARVANMMLEMTSGLRTEPPKITTFDRGNNDQMVTVLGIDYYSICEHHMVPFYGMAHVGYVPGKKIVGLSKFARILDWYAKRPQIQEQLTSQVADFILKEVDPLGVIVVIEGRHMCMSMRGVKKPNHLTVTSAIRGEIPKEEFFDILKTQQGKWK